MPTASNGGSRVSRERNLRLLAARIAFVGSVVVERLLWPGQEIGSTVGLARADLLPSQHLVDTGYVRTRNLLESRQQYQIDLLGPAPADSQWQLKARVGFDRAHFQVDWDQQVVHCPRGRPSAGWYPAHTPHGQPVIQVVFAAADCTSCPVRGQCTRAKSQPRGLTLYPRAENEAMQAARQRQTTADFAAQYARRAGWRAPSRRACAPSACARHVTAGSTKRTCNTLPPLPRSTSVA